MAAEAAAEGQETKKEAKARKKEEKKKKKEEKKAAKGDSEMSEESESGGSKIVVALATLVIIAIWLGILALLIKLDVGGFGSTVLHPILKDVPYVNKILPKVQEEAEAENLDYPYKTLDEAIAQIKVLEGQLENAGQKRKDDKAKIEDLQSQVRKLKKYKENEAQLEEDKQKFYEEVVFGDSAPEIEQYKQYYEMIDPDNAEVLYKEVVEQQQYDEKVDEFIETYSASSMKPKDAAAIFETMKDNMQLVKRILENLSAEDRGNILSAMTDKEMAAKLTEMLEPSKAMQHTE